MHDKKRGMTNKVKDEPEGTICHPRYKRYIYASFIALAVYVLIASICCMFWLGTHYIKSIDGISMQPGINNTPEGTGDIALVSTTETMHRGGIVIVDISSLDSSRNLIIKRVIAMSGDKLQMLNNGGYISIYVNDKLLVEDYIKDPYNQGVDKYYSFLSQNAWYTKVPRHLDKNNNPYIIIPENHFFFLGDNRNCSFDSRIMGPVHYDLLLGVVEKVFARDSFMNNFLRKIYGY